MSSVHQALDSLSLLATEQSAWCWLARYGDQAAAVVVHQDADPQATRFAQQVGELLGEHGTPTAAVRGTLSRMPSGECALAVREDPDEIAPLYDALCQEAAQVPTITILQMRGAVISKARRCEAPAAPSGDGGGDDIWATLM